VPKTRKSFSKYTWAKHQHLSLYRLDGTVSRLCHCGYAESVTLLAYCVLTWLTDHELIQAK